jgi:hypothetical protein
MMGWRDDLAREGPEDKVRRQKLEAYKRVVRALRKKAESETKRKNCQWCGRFVNTEGRCPKIFYDDYSGGWEHG